MLYDTTSNNKMEMLLIKRVLCTACVVIVALMRNAQALYSTKTAYADSFNPAQMQFISNPDNYKLNNCEAEQIYLFLRHGARYPNSKQVVKSRKFLDQAVEHRRRRRDLPGQSSDSTWPSVIEQLSITFEDKPAYALSDLGVQEMITIAGRFAQRFDHIFTVAQILNRSALNTQSSSKERSVDSAKSFLRGLLLAVTRPRLRPSERAEQSDFNRTLNQLSDDIEINDRMLRLFSECDRYLNEIEDNHTATADLYGFKTGSEMNELVETFKTRHGLQGFDVDAGIIIKLFTLCNIEYAHRMPDNWCRLFEPEDYETIAYYNDLKGYLKKSYGNELNAKMAFLILQDLFTEMDKHIRNDTLKHKILLRFGHAENMFPLVTALGLYRDESGLRVDNFEHNRKRRFRSGNLTPFSSNMAFVLHKCKPGDSSTRSNGTDTTGENYKVTVLVNEMPISQLTNAGRLDCASGSAHDSTCDYFALKKQLEHFLTPDYEEVCQNHDEL